jgi:hypothetical protein
MTAFPKMKEVRLKFGLSIFKGTLNELKTTHSLTSIVVIGWKIYYK